MRMILGVLAALAVLLAALPASGQSTSTTVTSAGVMSPATSSATDAPACWDEQTDSISIYSVGRQQSGFLAGEQRGATEPGGGFTYVAVDVATVSCDLRAVLVTARSTTTDHVSAVKVPVARDRTETGGLPGQRSYSIDNGADGNTVNTFAAALLRTRPKQSYTITATAMMRG